jgi:hypothetical protein
MRLCCSAAKEANATDRAIESGGRCRHIALWDGRGLSVRGNGATRFDGTAGF